MTSIARNGFATVLALALTGGPILLAPAQSLAQEKHKLSWSVRPENTQYTVQHGLDIADMSGHVIRLFEIRRTWPENAPMVEGLKVVEGVVRGLGDSVTGDGRAWGYSFWRLENGDLMFNEWQNANQNFVNPDGSRRVNSVGTYVTTGGTGKLRGIKGRGRFSGVSEFTAEGKGTRSAYSAEGEYWIEK